MLLKPNLSWNANQGITLPAVQAQVAYVNGALQVEFMVEEPMDCFRAEVREDNSTSWEDSCVEIFLRNPKKPTEYFNFDHQTAGSYIYSNKKTGAEFEVIKQTQIDEVVPVVGVKNDEAKSEKLYTLNGRQASENEKGIVITESGKKIKR